MDRNNRYNKSDYYSGGKDYSKPYKNDNYSNKNTWNQEEESYQDKLNKIDPDKLEKWKT